MSFALRRSQDRPPVRPPPRVTPASVITVASGKGGVGKTFVSISLASSLAQAGRRVLLVDGDLGLANVDVQLGIAPETDLAAVVAGWVELEDAVTALALQYDHVVIDLGAGIEANCMRLARSGDKALIVITDDPASMTDAYAFIKVLRGYAPSVEPLICINQADTRAAGQRTYEAIARACQTFLGFRPRLAGTVMRDPKVRDAIRCQKTLMSIDPQAQPVQDVIAVAQVMMGQASAEIGN
ncbi:MAG: cobyrinic acid a,c-diamide synthase [Hyphomonas sp. 34-62-18]|nr:AAA family ATPase [Hyphomonas sp. 34-62-18]OZB17199.1 MAG: cobyrinic acid a,c-diamide synthase [Hyphomonas sp. 34-62-18]